ncbi:MAG: raffinose/stachyose/melibiose transport system permease protein [Trebonia sp.]|jgi:raffinose/stachyose/melibiose transport system permease protein|nr:sugar transporter permease [Actinomycetes bacterium]MDX6341847.1 raffinose/stachyose/melibiose transport system permease protein [Trebonia sp.]
MMTAITAAAPPAGARGPRRRSSSWTVLPATYMVSIVILGVTVVPLLYVFLDGARSTAQIANSATALPNPWVWTNYSTILSSASFWEFLGNSALIAGVATVLAVGLGAMAAFALSRYVFRGREAFYTLFVSGLLFPLQIAALPLFLQLQLLGLLDNQFGVALPEAAFSLPITMLILRPFMRAIPGDIEDAALVDGAGRLRFFAQILLPMCRPALVTVALLAFVTSWNQFLLPLLVFSTQSHFTLPLGVYTYQSTYSSDTAIILAFTALAAVPALAVFVWAERYLVAGASGAVKG